MNGRGMAGTDTITSLADAFKVVGPVGQGLVNQQTANYNAGLATQEAKYAVTNAQFNENAIRNKGAAEIANQVASVGAGGIAFDGSAQAAVRQNAANIELDALTERYRGQIHAATDMSRAKMLKYQGRQDLYGGVASAGMKLLAQYRPQPSKPYTDIGV